jgi:hypothetical protein
MIKKGGVDFATFFSQWARATALTNNNQENVIQIQAD